MEVLFNCLISKENYNNFPDLKKTELLSMRPSVLYKNIFPRDFFVHLLYNIRYDINSQSKFLYSEKNYFISTL